MERLIFYVQGSSPEPYKVTFEKRSDREITAFCTCPAGENGVYCKHRISILNGLSENIVSKNITDAALVYDWLTGTKMKKTLLELSDLEHNASQIKKAIAKKKKELSLIMRGHEYA